MCPDKFFVCKTGKITINCKFIFDRLWYCAKIRETLGKKFINYKGI